MKSMLPNYLGFRNKNTMPRHSTIPTLYDECKTLTITKLKEWGYLTPGQWRAGTVSWSRNGNKYSSIGISVNTFAEQPYIELDYKCNDEPVKYKVYLVSIPSNIGKGSVWYFLCPLTGKRCRKLYMVSKYFLHRTAFRGCFYEKQTYSKRNRALNKTFEIFFGTDNVYEKIYSKYFKSHYAGKPTKRYLKLWKKLRDASEISERKIEEMIYQK